MELFDGRKAAQKIEEQLIETIQNLANPFGKELLIVQVGDNEASSKYVSLKLNLAKKLGIVTNFLHIPVYTTYQELEDLISPAFESTNVGGGIIQLPLPKGEFSNLLNLISVEKDIDLLSQKSQETFYAGDFERLPPVIHSAKYFIESIGLLIKDLKVTVVGEGYLVGKPLSFYLRKLGADVSVENSYYKGKRLDCQLLVLSAGIPNLIHPADIVPGCHVIDFGSSVVEGKTVGDLGLTGDVSHLGWVSPSPGGMGPMVVRYLLKNFLEFSLKR